MSPTLVNVHIDELTREWKVPRINSAEEINRKKYLNTKLTADDQIIIEDTDDKLQLSVHKRID